jgi:hypothetical protein
MVRSEDELWGQPVRPLGVGTLLEVDTSGSVDATTLAGQIQALHHENGPAVLGGEADADGLMR